MRRGRTAEDMSKNESMLVTVENRLTSLVTSLHDNMQKRIAKNPTPKVIQEMGKCLDLEDILEIKETLEIKQDRDRNLRKVMTKAKYSEEEKDQITEEYDLFQKKSLSGLKTVKVKIKK